MENTVETMLAAQMQDDAANTTPNNNGELAISDFLNNTTSEENVSGADDVVVENAAQQQPAAPGWIKTRIEKGVQKELAAREAQLRASLKDELRAEIRAEYEAQFAPIRASHMELEADKLVASGKFGDREIALEYLKLKGGAPEEKKQVTNQPRDAQGRFTTTQQPVSAEVQQRAQLLSNQAETIKAISGVDVMAIFNNSPSVQQKVLKGEWDFNDVYKNASNGGNGAPMPMRSSNMPTGNGGSSSIRSMSDSQFDRLEAELRSGKRFDLRR